MPKRIQRSRAKGWRMPEGAVYVGRPSKWGNPYVVGKPYLTKGSRTYFVRDRAHAVALFRDWYAACLSPEHPTAAFTKAALAELRGKDLACWCPLDQPCHADVLLELANG